MSTKIATYQLSEKTKLRLLGLLSSVQVANVVLEGAQNATQKFADRFNSASESALEQFDLVPNQPGLSVDWDTGVITVKTEVADVPTESLPEAPTEPAPEPV